jgi:phospho-N-acetylmuramoyl-pentapeptide-transferase
MTILVIASVSNGANLNDGMDGMAAGNSAIICVALGILAYVSSHITYASYLNIMYIPGSEELVIFICAMVGALIGFLWYNAYPAQIFMGDTGSLTIGGLIAVLAIIIHKELLIPVLCGVFLFESLSVILQVEYFKFFKKRGQSRRIFKRTPIHDAFRTLPEQMVPDCQYLLGNWPRGAWHESKITVRFWITTIILAAIAIITLKVR